MAWNITCEPSPPALWNAHNVHPTWRSWSTVVRTVARNAGVLPTGLARGGPVSSAACGQHQQEDRVSDCRDMKQCSVMQALFRAYSAECSCCCILNTAHMNI